MTEVLETEQQRFQRPSSRYEAYAVGGLVLQQALSAQLQLTNQLIGALVASAVLSPEKAQDLLFANARRLEKATAGCARKSIAHALLWARLENHAKALRGVAKKFAKMPAPQP